MNLHEIQDIQLKLELCVCVEAATVKISKKEAFTLLEIIDRYLDQSDD